MHRQHVNIGVAAALLVAGLVVGASFAREETEPVHQRKDTSQRFATIRVLDVFDGSELWRDFGQVFGERRRQMEAENEKRQEVLTQRDDEIDRFQAGSPERLERDRELLRLQMEYEVQARLRAAELDRLYRVWLNRTYREISATAGQLARELGFDAVMSVRPPGLKPAEPASMMQQIVTREVIYVDPALDLTRDVLARLNQTYAEQGGMTTLRRQLDPLAMP